MANQYDALAAGLKPQDQTADANPYDVIVEDIQVQQQQRTRTVYEKSLATNPDQAAEALRLSKQTGLPTDTVERNLDEVRRKEQARMLDLQRMAVDSPVLARQLADPTFTKQAHDDIGALEQVGQFFTNTGKAAKAGVYNASKGAAGVFRAGFELAAPALDVLEPVTAIGGNPLRRLAEGFAMAGEAADATAKAAAPKGEGNISAGYYSGIQSLTRNLLALPMAFAPGGQGAALSMMTATTGGQSYQDAREKGLSMSQALPFAASQAAIEYATERLPLGALIGDVKAGTGILKTLAKQMALEVPGEQVATILQDMNEWAVLNPEKPFRDYIAERPDAAAQTLVATIVGTGGNVTVAKGIETATRKLMGDAYDAGLAEQGADQLQTALQTAAQSKLRERNPEQFRALMQSMSENTEGAPQEVYLDAEVLNQLTPEVLAQLPQSVIDALPAALAANDVVSIPVADVLTVAPGTPLEQALIENARIGDPMAMSQAEAKTAGEQAQQYLAQEAERVIAQATDAQTMQESSDRVRQGLLDQLNTAGRFSPAVNEAYATWTTAFYTTMAGRLGINPEEMAAKYPLRIGAQAGQGATLEQITPEQAMETNVTTEMPTAPEFEEAVGNTPGAQITDNGLLIDLVRYQKPEQEGAQAIRTGVFYLPVKSANTKHYKTTPTTKNPNPYGGSEKMEGQTLIRRPLFVKGATGGKAPEAAYDAVKGKGAMKTLDKAVMDVVSSRGFMTRIDPESFLMKVEQFLGDFGGERGLASEIIRNSTKGNTLRYALQEHVIAHAVRAAGYDAVVGYSKGKAGANISEVFDVREQSFPARAMESDVHSDFYNQGARATFNPETLELVLNENANLSSFLHETGHFFLEVMADLSNQPDAPAEIQEDMAALLKWFGIKGDETVGGLDAGGDLAQNPTDHERLDAEALAVSRGADSAKIAAMTDDELRRELFRLSRPVRKESAPKVKTLKALMKRAGSTNAEELDERYGITVADDGLVEIDKLTEGNAKVIGDLPVAFYHHTSTALLPTIEREGLKVGKQTNFFNTQAGVYVTLIQAGTPVTTYSRRAAKVHGGEPTTLRLKRRVSDVIPDPDDADLAWAQGKQFITPGVPPSDLAPLADEFAQDGDLPTDSTQPAGRTPLETWNAMTLDQKRQYHERFAESFEQYLLEGKAPSLELQPLFRKFKRWMENVYQSLKSFVARHPDSGIVLSPEIRQVFDRMLATRDQIAQAEEVAGLLPDADATEEAVEALTARSLRDLKWTVNARAREIKKLQKQAAELRKGVEAEVRAEVEAMPVYAARKFLRTDTKLAIADLEAIYAGEGDRFALLDWKPLVDQKLAGKTGQHPDIIADMFDFESGDAMVRAILDAEPIASVIEGMTDQRMLERHGDLIDDRAIAEAANEAVHNEARARALATELKVQADALSARAETGETNAKGSKVTVSVIAEAAKQFAANVVARTPIRDLKSRAWQHVAAERRAGKRWQEATAKGQTQDAIKAKQDQVLNNAAAKAAGEAQAEMRKILDFFKRVVKDNNEKTVEKGRDPDVVNAARAVLVAYGVAPRAGKSALDYMDVLQKNDPAMFNALQPSVQAALNMAQPLDSLTMDELRSLHDEIQGMWYLAKRSRQMEVDGNLMDLEETADLLHERMTEIGIPDEIPGERGSITEAEELGIKLQFARAILRRVEQWSESLDGKFGGPFLRFVFQPIKTAADRYRTDKVKYRERLTELVKGIADKMPPGKIVAPELGYTFGNGKDSGTAELLHAMLHTGNDSNKRKLLLGRQWATENPDGTLDTSRWDTFMQRMHDSGAITQAHWEFAQGVWDLLEEMKPLAQKTHRDVYGRYFAEVTANPVATPFGEYRGGYVPAQTDSRLVKDAKLRELAEGENESMAYAFPSSPSGFTKGRVEYNQPLLLDLRALGQHMDKVLLFSHMQGAVTDVRRLLTRKNVSYGLNRIDPGAYEGMLIPWLNRAAKQIVETPVAGDRKLSRFLSAARSRAGMALMFGNISNTLQQITGFSLAAVKVKPALVMKATAQFIAHPKQMRATVAEASEFMKNRMLNEVSAMNDAVEQILVNPGLLERSQAWTQQHAYFLQTAMANTMEPIVWTAAYNQSIEQGASEQEARKFADGTIRQTQGSTLPEDISRFESGPAYGRVFTQFIGYFNMMANTNATAAKQITEELGLKKGAGKLLYVALAGMMAPIWVAEAIAVAMRGGPDDEDKDGYLDDWLAAVFGIGTLRGLVAQVPIVGQAAQLAVNRFNDNPADDKFSLSPAVSLIESTVSAPASVYKAIMEDGSAMKATKDVAAAATMLTGLPIFAIARPVSYAVGVAENKVEPTSAGDAVRGAITGTASKESKQP